MSAEPQRSAHTDWEDTPPPPGHKVWLEVAGLTLLLPLLGRLLHPMDPLFQHASFPWLQLAPLLLGLRHGFARGVVSALGLGVLLGIDHVALHPEAEFPASLALGILLTAMLAGEFCDLWRRRQGQLAELYRHQRSERELFTRAYHLLAQSHQRLERRVLGNTRSLREALTDVRRLALHSGDKDGGQGEAALWQAALTVFASFGEVQVGALHRVGPGRGGALAIHSEPVAALGRPAKLRPDDPLCSAALQTGKVISALGTTDAAAAASLLLAAVPLCDIAGRTWGLLAIEEMPFLLLGEDHLRLLALLGGLCGDALALSGAGAQEVFRAQLVRWQRSAVEFGLATTLMALCLPAAQGTAEAWVDEILTGHRDLDHPLILRDRAGRQVLFLLLPLTDEEGAKAYLARLDGRLRDRGGLAGAGVRVERVALTGAMQPAQAEAPLFALAEACDVILP